MIAPDPWHARIRRKLAAWIWAQPEPDPAPPTLPSPPLSGPTPTPEDRYFLKRRRFEGTLSGHGSSVPVGFDAWIDGLGALHVKLDTMDYSPEVGALSIDQRPGTPVDLLELEGVSEDDHRLRSDSFSITHRNHGSVYEIQGDCYDAEIELPADRRHDTSHDTRAWRVRQLSTFRVLARDTPLGRVIIRGPQYDRSSQDPGSAIAIHRPQGDTNADWWAESERLITHVARVLSFAADTYLRPVNEERYDGGTVKVRVVRQGPASPPFMAPFLFLHMQQIFDLACASYFDRYEKIEQLDAAIRWLTAPVAYDESRLINAMSALENIVARCDLEEIEFFLDKPEFNKLAKAVRGTLKAQGAPAQMNTKVTELNRRSLGHKIEALIAARGIVTDDFPPEWLATIIRQRNLIVHTGVSPQFGEFEPDTLDHTIWAREIATRIILERLGFAGGFRSWLHHDEQYRFPECVPMKKWVRDQQKKSAF